MYDDNKPFFPADSELFWPDWKNELIYPIGPSFDYHDNAALIDRNEAVRQIMGNLKTGFLGVFGKKHDHDLASKILGWDFSSVLVCGQPGSGRTAAGLKFAKRLAVAKLVEGTFGNETSVPPRIINIFMNGDHKLNDLALSGEYAENSFKTSDIAAACRAWEAGRDVNFYIDSEDYSKIIKFDYIRNVFSQFSETHCRNAVFMIDGMEAFENMEGIQEFQEIYSSLLRRGNAFVYVTDENCLDYFYKPCQNLFEDENKILMVKTLAPGDPALAKIGSGKLFLMEVRHEPAANQCLEP